MSPDQVDLEHNLKKVGGLWKRKATKSKARNRRSSMINVMQTIVEKSVKEEG